MGYTCYAGTKCMTAEGANTNGCRTIWNHDNLGNAAHKNATSPHAYYKEKCDAAKEWKGFNYDIQSESRFGAHLETVSVQNQAMIA